MKKKTLNTKSLFTVIGGILFAMAMSITFETDETIGGAHDSGARVAIHN